MGELGDKLISLLDYCYEYEKQYLATLTDEERTATGAADDWAPKDVLAHVAHWDVQAAKELVDPATYEPPDYGDDFNAMMNNVSGADVPDTIISGSQYNNARMVRDADRVIVH